MRLITAPRSRGLLMSLAGVLLLLAGAAVIKASIIRSPEIPMPQAPITAAPTQTPTGPTSATINDVTVASPDMAAEHLLIPAIDAYAPILHATIRSGQLALPHDASQVARWTPSAELNALEGNTLMAGHVINTYQRGALFRLGELQAGNIAYITDADGNVQEFQLQRLTAVIKSALPTSVWDTDGPRQLTVVTCTGPVIQTATGSQYRDNLIAVFVPAGAD